MSKLKASDLRIGNLINYIRGDLTKKIITVGWRFFSSASIEKKDSDIQVAPYYTPIPLTEEWLVKFGFVKNIDCEGYNLNGLIFLNGYLTDSQRKPLQYVHQLQNLYFCLTGEELSLL